MQAINLANKFEKSCQSMVVVSNWDSLNSKSVLIEFSDYLVCFGQKSKDFAVRIHNIRLSRIYPIGSARCETHSELSQNVISETKTILIKGV